MKLTGGEIIMKSLEDEGVPYIVGIPGHGCLGLFDAIKKADDEGKIKYIQVKHEQTATHIADGYYRTCGKPLAVFASVGPGALNTTIGIGTAYVDSTSMLVLAGDTHVHMKGVGVLQEIERQHDSNFISVMKPIAKRAWRAESVGQLPKIMQRAFNQMLTGRPGPVVVALPMDVQSSDIDVNLPALNTRRTQSRPAAEHNAVLEAVALMKTAKRPVIIAGGAALRSGSSELLVRLAEAWGAAVVTTMAGKSAFPEDHPLYCFHTGSKGTPIGLHVTRNADVVLALGTRFADETTCSYRYGKSFCFPETKLIHVDIESGEIGKNYACDVGIIGDLTLTMEQLLDCFTQDGEPVPFQNNAYTKEIESEKAKWFDTINSERKKTYDKMTISQLLESLNQHLPVDTIIATSSGNTQAQCFQEYCFKNPQTHLTTGGFSTMGWAVPAAIGAKLAKPNTPVIALLGDGDFMMIMQELSTIAQYNIPIVIVLANNNGWLAIKDLQQDMLGTDRSFGTVWEKDGKSYTPDFVTIAKAFDVASEKIEKQADIAAALERAFKSNKPYLIEVTVTDKYPESGGAAFGWWDVPIPTYLEERRQSYEEGLKEEVL